MLTVRCQDACLRQSLILWGSATTFEGNEKWAEPTDRVVPGATLGRGNSRGLPPPDLTPEPAPAPHLWPPCDMFCQLLEGFPSLNQETCECLSSTKPGDVCPWKNSFPLPSATPGTSSVSGGGGCELS